MGLWTDLAATVDERSFWLGDYDPGLDLIISHLQNFTNETASFDGTNWANVATATDAPNTTDHGMAYDGVGVIMFGGTIMGMGTLQDPPETWRFSSADWHHLSPGTVPSKRANMSLCAIPGGALMFGGTDGTGVPYLNETYLWDQSDWTLLSPATPPPVRIGGQMCHIPGFGVLLFGGTDDVTLALGDTWFFDLDTLEWSELTGSLALSPDPRFFGGMAYNGTMASMFGGRVWPGATGPSVFKTDETWLFDHENIRWCFCDDLATAPIARDEFAMVYDSLRERAVIWSGDATPNDSDTTWAFTGDCCEPLPVRATVNTLFGLGR